VGAAKIQFVDDELGVDIARDLVFATALANDAVGADWDSAEEVADCAITDLEKTAEAGASFAELPAAGANSKNYTAWNKSFAAWLFRMQKLDLMRSPSLVDLRNVYRREDIAKHGFRYFSIGRPDHDIALQFVEAAE